MVMRARHDSTGVSSATGSPTLLHATAHPRIVKQAAATRRSSPGMREAVLVQVTQLLAARQAAAPPSGAAAPQVPPGHIDTLAQVAELFSAQAEAARGCSD
jgi:hypothetical protein